MPSSSAGLDAITIDAFGTLVELEDPVGRLRAALRGRGVERDEQSVAAAFAAEVEYYLVHKGEGHDDDSLLDLRTRCAGVFLDGVAPVGDYSTFPTPVEVNEFIRGGHRLVRFGEWSRALSQVR